MWHLILHLNKNRKIIRKNILGNLVSYAFWVIGIVRVSNEILDYDCIRVMWCKVYIYIMLV